MNTEIATIRTNDFSIKAEITMWNGIPTIQVRIAAKKRFKSKTKIGEHDYNNYHFSCYFNLPSLQAVYIMFEEWMTYWNKGTEQVFDVSHMCLQES